MNKLIVLAFLFLFSCEADEKNLKPYRVKYISSFHKEIHIVHLDSNYRVGDVVIVEKGGGLGHTTAVIVD